MQQAHTDVRLAHTGLTLWVGGLLAIDVVETPARFRTMELDRNQVIAVGRQVFAATNRVELGLGALLLLGALRGGHPALASAAGGMWLAALAQALLGPSLWQSSGGIDFRTRNPGDPRVARVRRLHRVYIALDVVKLALGLWAVLGSRPG